jgi:hypothetical protein
MRTIFFGAAMVALQGCVHVAAGGHAATAQAADAHSATAAAQDTPVADPQPERSDFSTVLADGKPVVVDNPYGDVRLRFGGFAHALEINAVFQRPTAAAPIVLQPVDEPGRYLIAPRLPAGAVVAEGQRLDIVVFVPIGHAASARTERGLIESHGVRGNVDLRSTSGDIKIRGTQGSVQAQTGAGSIEASFNTAPVSSHQHLATTTGNIVLAIDDRLDAELELATSSVFSTEFSLDVTPTPGQEPNKRAHTVVGEDKARIVVESRRGEIRLLRRSGFRPLDGKPAVGEYEDNDSD